MREPRSSISGRRIRVGNHRACAHRRRRPNGLRAIATRLASAAIGQRRSEAILVRAQAAYLAYLADGSRYRNLSFSSLGDFAEESLGMRSRTAYDRVSLHRLLSARPEAEQALLDGSLSVCQLFALRPVLAGTGQDAARWIEDARNQTVQEIRRRVRDARPDSETTPVDGCRVAFASPLEFTVAWKEMMDLACKVLGYNAPQYKCIEAILAESGRAGSGVAPEARARGEAPLPREAPPRRLIRPRHAALRRARETLVLVAEYQSTVADLIEEGTPRDAFDARDRLIQIDRLRAPQRVFFARLLSDLRDSQAVFWLGFRSMERFVEQSLGLSGRSARARMDESDLFSDSPELEDAYGRGEIGIAQAFMIRLLAQGRWTAKYIRRAREVTLRQLRREFAIQRMLSKSDRGLAAQFAGPFPHPGLDEALRNKLIGEHGWTETGIEQAMKEKRIPPLDSGASLDPAENPVAMARLELLSDLLTIAIWDEPPAPTDDLPRSMRQTSAMDRSVRISFWAPLGVAADFHAAVETIRKEVDPRLETWQAVALLFAPVYEEWTRRDPGRRPSREAILLRDSYLCQFPGCSRRSNLEAHHPNMRSHGGRDTADNMLTLCHTHHQDVIHAGYAWVSGRAPQSLSWRLGLRPNQPPLLELNGERYVRGR